MPRFASCSRSTRPAPSSTSMASKSEGVGSESGTSTWRRHVRWSSPARPVISAAPRVSRGLARSLEMLPTGIGVPAELRLAG